MKTKRIDVREREREREREWEAMLLWPVVLYPKRQRSLLCSQGSEIEPTASSQEVVELNLPTPNQNGALWVLTECPWQTKWLVKTRVKKENHLGLMILGIKGTVLMNVGTTTTTTTIRKENNIETKEKNMKEIWIMIWKWKKKEKRKNVIFERRERVDNTVL